MCSENGSDTDGDRTRQEETKPTMTIHMKAEDAELVRKFVEFEGMTISDFARSVILEKIEDSHDLKEFRHLLLSCGSSLLAWSLPV